MRLILVTGGARSGKSSYAERRARALGGDAVTFVATATPSDEEMAARIARHRAERPVSWRTIEARHGVGAAITGADTDVVLIDCLTLLTANALVGGSRPQAVRATDSAAEDAAHAAVTAEIDELLSAAADRGGTLLVVSNEVGLGVVPHTTAGRWFRDALGTANRRVAEAADEVILMVAGIPLWVKAGRDDSS